MENHGSKVWTPTQMWSNLRVTFRTLCYHGNQCFDLVAVAGLHILKTQILQQWKNYRLNTGLFLFETSHISRHYANVTQCSYMVMNETDTLAQQTDQGWRALKHLALALLLYCINQNPHTSPRPAAQEGFSCLLVYTMREARGCSLSHSTALQFFMTWTRMTSGANTY